MKELIKLDHKTAKALSAIGKSAPPDKQATTLARTLRQKVSAACAKIQRHYRDTAKARYESHHTGALFTESAPYIINILQSVLSDLEKEDVSTLRRPNLKEDIVIAKLLSTPTILCYPCFELSANLKGRDFLDALRPLLHNDTIAIADTSSARSLVRHDILFLRERTVETKYQDDIFDLLQRIALAGAKRMKSLQARNEAIQWLKALNIVQSRLQRHDARLTEESAAQLVSEMHAAHDATGLALQYESV